MKLIALITLVAAIAAGSLLGGVLREARPDAASAGAAARSQLLGLRSARDTVGRIRALQAVLKTSPEDAQLLTRLGLVYQQRYRETADPAYLTRAAGLFRKTLRLQPGDADATGGLAGVALSRHQFRQALVLARSAQRRAPGSAGPYAALGDALLELGRYDEATIAFDRMTALRPGLGAYARIAYARELRGDRAGALEAMSLAADVAGGREEPTAWTLVELGKLHFNSGALGRARAAFRFALRTFPGYVYALDWLARTEASSGRYAEAVRLAQQAVDAVPLPQFVATLAEVHRARGDEQAAREQYALVGAIERLLRTGGVNADLELALFRVDHGIRLPQTLELARRARAGRPSIYGDDVLAWALARNGRCAEARGYSQRSLRLGTKDASLYFHRGMIERCLGNDGAARTWFRRAVATNPHFSLIWADTARRYAS